MIKAYFPDLDEKQKTAGSLLLLITLTMLVLEYYGIQKSFYSLNQKYNFFVEKNDIFFYAQVYTSSCFLLFLFFIPLTLSRFIGKQLKSETGLGLGESSNHIKSYSLIILFMLPFLFLATASPSLHNFYPLYKPSSLQNLLAYESIYLLQFIGTEFFFRGWPLLMLDKILGKVSIFIMVVPYALIHIHKPFIEALASILAGVVLGNLAIKTKSIWPGVLVHGMVAICADLFSLYHSGRFSAFFD